MQWNELICIAYFSQHWKIEWNSTQLSLTEKFVVLDESIDVFRRQRPVLILESISAMRSQI